jgi:hypothetical protein
MSEAVTLKKQTAGFSETSISVYLANVDEGGS